MAKLTVEEKKVRSEQRQKEKWNKVHKFIGGADHKLCGICENWFPSNNEYFYNNKANYFDGLNTYCINCTKKKSFRYQKENPDKRKVYLKKANAKPERKKSVKEANKKYREKGGYKEWQDNNKDKLNIYGIDRKGRKAHKISDEEWIKCKEYFNNECGYCGLHISEHFNRYAGELKWTDLHREHVDDKGSNEIENCIPSCKSCNSKKHTSDIKDWYNNENPVFSEERLKKIHKWLQEDVFKA